MTTLNEKFLTVEESMGQYLLERDEEIHTALLGLVGGMHQLQYGVPGVAKSHLVNTLCDHIT